MKYDKPPLTIQQQIDLLLSRGMVISDRDRATRYLTHINYYRLRAYWLIFETTGADGNHTFRTGTRFQDVLSLYVFDRKFRMLVLEAIERIEVSFRTRFAYVLATKYGSHSYLDLALFATPAIHEQCIANFREEYNRSRETFIEHYKTKYGDPELPPIWAACEVMSFGQLSRWFQNIKARKDRQEIAAEFRIDEKVLGSFMHHLTHIRNLSAHHSRLWNRRLTFTMMLPRKPDEITRLFNPASERYIYNTVAMLGFLVNLMSPGTTWPARMRKLIEEYPLVQPGHMGFPANWKELPLWSNRT